jgi:lysozyme
MITNITGQLLRDEGTRQFPYTDTKGTIAIGIGRNLTREGVSEDEISLMLSNDIAKATRLLTDNLPWFSNIEPVRQGVLINMIFNMGLAGLLGFHKALTDMQNGMWELAALEILTSTWATQVGPRAQRLAEQLKTGVWQ